MSTSSYFYNIIPFTPVMDELTLYFSDQASRQAQRVYHKLLPSQVLSYYTTSDGQPDHLYCSFTKALPEFSAFNIAVQKLSSRFMVRYFSWFLKRHFQAKGFLTKTGFTREVQVYIYNNKVPLDSFYSYSKFSLKVQYQSVSEQYELLLSYLGQSKVFKKDSVKLTQEVASSHFNWVIYKEEVVKWDDLKSAEKKENLAIAYHQVFPVLNKSIERALGLPFSPNRNKNPFKNYYKSVTGFYQKHLLDADIEKELRLDENGFLAVPQNQVFNTPSSSNMLTFGDGFEDRDPKFALKNHPPFEPSGLPHITVFFILHASDKENAKFIKQQFDSGFHGFKGLYDYVGLTLHVERGLSIVFQNLDDPLPEISEQLAERSFDPAVSYVGIYLTPFDKDERDESKKGIYYQVKELLLQYQITSQVINPRKMNELGQNWKYSLPNIAIALLAKLEGVPWKLAHEASNELVVGVGAFYSQKDDVKYIGSSFSFQNDGRFQRFEYFQKNDIDLLAGSISASIREFTVVHDAPERLIIHFYKAMSRKELRRIMRELKNMELSIPVHIVSINKTESRDIVAFDLGWEERLPKSGTIIQVGKHQYLLYNNTRYSSKTERLSDGYPFPIKIKLDSSDPAALNDIKMVKTLIDQVYQFSRMYWKSLRQQNLPVTIKYPEMVAQIAPHFANPDIPDFGKRNLWFL